LSLKQRPPGELHAILCIQPPRGNFLLMYFSTVMRNTEQSFLMAVLRVFTAPVLTEVSCLFVLLLRPVCCSENLITLPSVIVNKFGNARRGVHFLPFHSLEKTVVNINSVFHISFLPFRPKHFRPDRSLRGRGLDVATSCRIAWGGQSSFHHYSPTVDISSPQ
jgi:hypothetical protein